MWERSALRTICKEPPTQTQTQLMSISARSLRPLAPVIRHGTRSLATARPLIPEFDDEPGLPELEIPSPNVYPKNGSNILEVKSNLPYHTLAHTLAIVRAVEAKCGRVINVNQYRVSLFRSVGWTPQAIYRTFSHTESRYTKSSK